MAKSRTVESTTPARAWRHAWLVGRSLEVARDEQFNDAKPIELREAGEALLGQLPIAGAEQVWLRLASGEHPWPRDWRLEIRLDAIEDDQALTLSANAPVACLRTRGEFCVRLVVHAAERFARPSPLPMCEPVPVQDVAFGRRTRQSSAAEAIDAAPPRWMTPTQVEAGPWWEIDTGATHHIDELRIRVTSPEAGDVRLWIFTGRTRAGAPAAPHVVTLRLEGSTQVLELGVVGRYLRIEALTTQTGPVSLALASVEIWAAPLRAESLLATVCRSFTLFAERPLFARREREAGRLGGYARWTPYREVWARATNLAAALARRLERDDERIFVGICASGRADWIITDLACITRNYVVVPFAPTDGVDTWIHVIHECKMRALACSPDLVDQFLAIAKHCPSLELIVEMAPVELETRAAPEGPATARPIHVLSTALEREGELAGPLAFAPRAGDDLYTVLYTSGSTGRPKGAMRSHDAFNALVAGSSLAQPAVYLSYQPLSHLTERITVPLVIQNGGQIGFASDDRARLFEDVACLQPSFFSGAPRVFDVLRSQYNAATSAARSEFPDADSATLAAGLLAEFRSMFGPRLQVVLVGSAKSSPALLEFMRELFADCWMIEGYGLTEVGVVSIDGMMSPDVDVKLIDVPELGYSSSDRPPRGEICVRTPRMISGYLGDAATTEQQFDEQGYFRTGDLGQREPDGRLRIVGRRKHVIKLAQGEFVAPERIEALLLASPVVDQIYVDARELEACVVAIVIPNPSALRELVGALPDDWCDDLAIRGQVQRALHDVGRRAGLRSFELPAALGLDHEPMSIENGLLTASGKPKRRAIAAHHREALDALYPSARAARPTSSLIERVEQVASSMLGVVHPDADLRTLQLDSLAGVELVARLQAELGREIPLDLWFAASSLADFAQRIEGQHRGADARAQALVDLEAPLPSCVASVAACPPREHLHEYRHVILTGATGFLGRSLLEVLLDHTTATVTCLVRARTPAAASQRLREQLSAGGVTWLDEWGPRVRVCCADLGRPSLGLDVDGWMQLADSADAIIHAGAMVNWITRYDQLREANVLGTLELLRLAATGRRKAFHLVSTIGTTAGTGDEDTSLSRAHALAGSGYSLSKWIAEQRVREAGGLGLPITIHRPAMITGHSVRGHANASDFVGRYLTGSAQLGLYLDIDATVDMTPVDFVSRAIVALSREPEAIGRTFHLTNIERSPSYRELGEAMRRAGVALRPASYADFRAALLEAGENGGPASNALLPLRSYFPRSGWALHMGPWPSAQTRALLEPLGVRCPAVDDELIAAYVRALV